VIDGGQLRLEIRDQRCLALTDMRLVQPFSCAVELQQIGLTALRHRLEGFGHLCRLLVVVILFEALGDPRIGVA
jgi:hypothetical protein